MIEAILISGTPASGKDTISEILVNEIKSLTLFKKDKIDNNGNRKNYNIVSKEEFEKKKSEKEYIQYHYRYNSGYGIARKEIEKHKKKKEIPIIHIGKYENLKKIEKEKIKTLKILFICEKKETEKRLKKREKNQEEIEKRLKAYDEEIEEMEKEKKEGELLFDLEIDTGKLEKKEIVKIIKQRINQ